MSLKPRPILEREIPEEMYRGLVTDRGLTEKLNRQFGEPDRAASLDTLGIELEQIIRKRVLDVGIGGGFGLRQARKLGIDYHGIDIIPRIDPASVPSDNRVHFIEMRSRFFVTAASYPNHVKAADFCNEDLSYDPDGFDIVLSCCGLPMYARNPQEAIISVLNMINFSKELVAFNIGINYPDLYLGKNGFIPFNLKGLLDLLGKFGISHEIQPVIGSTKMAQAAHLNTSHKDSYELLNYHDEIIQRANEFSVI